MFGIDYNSVGEYDTHNWYRRTWRTYQKPTLVNRFKVYLTQALSFILYDGDLSHSSRTKHY